jgi:hypothetical protein
LDQSIGVEIRWVLAGTSTAVLLFFTFPGPLLNSAQMAAKALFSG